MEGRNIEMTNHERCRIPNYNRYIAHYGQKLGALAVNTALVIKHEVFPPKLDPIPINRSELVILDDENAAIREVE